MDDSVKFEIVSKHKPTGDQPTAISSLVEGLENGKHFQVLLGATGTGKTFTIANVIEKVQKPTLVLVHNKTLAGQLYSELKELFPNNKVEYFVSNFDFYQPEAYIPRTDTYIDKNAVMNEDIEIMRSSAVNSVISRKDTIIVGSVASIYGLSDPEEYRSLVVTLRVGDILDRKKLFDALIEGQYHRNNLETAPGTFRVRGDIIEICPSSTVEYIVKIDTFGDEIERIVTVNPLTGEVIHKYKMFPIFPANAHASTQQKIKAACKEIRSDLADRLVELHSQNKLLEEQRLEMRTRQDIESLEEFGICPGIENYSRYIDGRKEGEPPYTLIDYFPDDFLLVIDESHVTLPQVRGMYNGDRARKTTLVEYGFRLPSALDNRPLRFEEFESKMRYVICTSATPGDYELEHCNNEVVEQIIRPTGLLDPIVHVRSTRGQIDDLINEIKERINKNERTLITTLTIRMAEDLTAYLKDRGYKVAYLHSETKTLERTAIIYELRKGTYDVLVGINLLREGLDIPEVSLVAILDADKEGFLRSSRSLIQIIGRAARNANGTVIMYADSMTDSMNYAIEETKRRRAIQEKYNEENGIVPTTIIKDIAMPLGVTDDIVEELNNNNSKKSRSETKQDIKKLESQMKEAAKNFDFERAAKIRDIIIELKEKM